MGINWVRPSYIERMHGVDVCEKSIASSGKEVIRRTYSTSVGDIYLEEIREPGVGQWHGQRSWNDVLPWQTSRLIKDPEDYKVMKYIVENTEYVADYFPIEQAMNWLGDEGVVIDGLPHSPMQTLMIDWVGSEQGRFFFHLVDHPDLVEDLYRALCKSREPLYEIAAESPADIVLCGDNVDGFLVNPKIFEKYFLPEYEKQAKILHAHGKLMAVHMDGRLRVLKDLIGKSSIDIVEGFHPPPMGDLPVSEALSIWKDKVIWIGFPGTIYSFGPETTKKYTLELLKGVGSGERLAVAASTENLVSNENILMLTSVLENANLPLEKEKIEGRGKFLV